MPAPEEVFRLRNCVVPIELKQPCRADGACPSASTGLGPTAAKEGGDPVSTPWSPGAYTPTNYSEYAACAILLSAESVMFMLHMRCELLSRLYALGNARQCNLVHIAWHGPKQMIESQA